MYSALKAKLKKTSSRPRAGLVIFHKNSKIDSELRKQFQVTKIGEWVDPIIVFDASAYYGLFLHFHRMWKLQKMVNKTLLI